MNKHRVGLFALIAAGTDEVSFPLERCTGTGLAVTGEIPLSFNVNIRQICRFSFLCPVVCVFGQTHAFFRIFMGRELGKVDWHDALIVFTTINHKRPFNNF